MIQYSLRKLKYFCSCLWCLKKKNSCCRCHFIKFLFWVFITMTLYIIYTYFSLLNSTIYIIYFAFGCDKNIIHIFAIRLRSRMMEVCYYYKLYRSIFWNEGLHPSHTFKTCLHLISLTIELLIIVVSLPSIFPWRNKFFSMTQLHLNKILLSGTNQNFQVAIHCYSIFPPKFYKIIYGFLTT